jgi:UDP-glucose 4-epimerase
VIGDAQDPLTVIDVIDRLQPQTIYHLAANSDIQAGVADASLDFGDTLMTTIALRAALPGRGVSRLVFASSSAIFGISQQPFAEASTTPPAPVSWYGKAKLASEFVLESLAAADPAMAILVVRFPNVVGPLATHGVVFDFVRRLRANPDRLDVLGDGNQTKPYVHVAELIRGIQHFSTDLAPGLKRVNIGPSDVIDVKGIVQEVTAALEVSPTVAYQKSPFGWPGDVPHYSFDTSLMRREGFTIESTSRQAVRRAADDLALEITD